jgi:hypothetical protein
MSGMCQITTRTTSKHEREVWFRKTIQNLFEYPTGMLSSPKVHLEQKEEARMNGKEPYKITSQLNENIQTWMKNKIVQFYLKWLRWDIDWTEDNRKTNCDE